MAAVHAGGFGMGIYQVIFKKNFILISDKNVVQTNTAAACQYVCDHSRANILVVENR